MLKPAVRVGVRDGCDRISDRAVQGLMGSSFGCPQGGFDLLGLLGLTPEASERRLRIIRPILPDFVDRLEVQRLQGGRARVTLRFERLSEGVAVNVLKVEGALDVIIEPETSMTSTPEAGRV